MADPHDTPTAPAPRDTAERIWFRVIRLHGRLHAAMGARLRALKLSVPQFDVLSTLTERPGMTQSELAERLYVTKGNVSGLIDRLVEAGLVLREPSPGDRRSHALRLTPEGMRLAALGLKAQRALIGETLGRMPAADLAALDRLSAAWRDSVRSLADGGACETAPMPGSVTKQKG